MDCYIRLATTEDAQAISNVVISALRESNAQDYCAAIIAQVEQSFSPQAIVQWLSLRKVYVATVEQRVVATASLDAEVVRSVFVEPQQQGRGIGRQLMDEIHQAALRAQIDVLKVPSSITAQGFYTSLGYEKVRDEFHGAERTIVMRRALKDL